MLLVFAWGCQPGWTLEGITASLVRIYLERCTKQKFSIANTPKYLSSAHDVLYRCLRVGSSCYTHMKAKKATYISDMLELTRHIEHKICGYLSWTPGNTHKLIVHKWHIKIEENWLICIKMNYFYIPYSQDCIVSRMVLTRYKYRHDKLKTYCGFRLPWTYTVNGNAVSMFAVWHNDRESKNYIRFHGYFESLSTKPILLPGPEQMNVTEPEFMLYSWKAQATGTIGGKPVYTYVVQTYIKNILHTTVSSSSTTQWYMYDGPDDTFPQLDRDVSTSGFLLFIKVHGHDRALYFSIVSTQYTETNCSYLHDIQNILVDQHNVRSLFCRQWFSTKNYPKIHMDSFNVIAPDLISCTWAGLAFGFELDGKVVMLRPMCNSNFQVTQPLFVAPNSSMFVLIYAYEALVIDVQLTIYDERNCPGVPVMCGSQSGLFPVPTRLKVATIAELHISERTNNLMMMSGRWCTTIPTTKHA